VFGSTSRKGTITQNDRKFTQLFPKTCCVCKKNTTELEIRYVSFGNVQALSDAYIKSEGR
jgi:hypothetical protein